MGLEDGGVDWGVGAGRAGDGEDVLEKEWEDEGEEW